MTGGPVPALRVSPAWAISSLISCATFSCARCAAVQSPRVTPEQRETSSDGCYVKAELPQRGTRSRWLTSGSNTRGGWRSFPMFQKFTQSTPPVQPKTHYNGVSFTFFRAAFLPFSRPKKRCSRKSSCSALTWRTAGTKSWLAGRVCHKDPVPHVALVSWDICCTQVFT